MIQIGDSKEKYTAGEIIYNIGFYKTITEVKTKPSYTILYY